MRSTVGRWLALQALSSGFPTLPPTSFRLRAVPKRGRICVGWQGLAWFGALGNHWGHFGTFGSIRFDPRQIFDDGVKVWL